MYPRYERRGDSRSDERDVSESAIESGSRVVMKRVTLLLAAVLGMVFCMHAGAEAAGSSAIPGSVFNDIPEWARSMLDYSALGLAGIFMVLGFLLIMAGKDAATFMRISAACFVLALAVDAAKFFWPHQMLISVDPVEEDFPPSLKYPVLTDNVTRIKLSSGASEYACRPNHNVHFSVEGLVVQYSDLAGKYSLAMQRLGTAVEAGNIGKDGSQFGPDVTAGAGK